MLISPTNKHTRSLTHTGRLQCKHGQTADAAVAGTANAAWPDCFDPTVFKLPNKQPLARHHYRARVGLTQRGASSATWATSCSGLCVCCVYQLRGLTAKPLKEVCNVFPHMLHANYFTGHLHGPSTGMSMSTPAQRDYPVEQLNTHKTSAHMHTPQIHPEALRQTQSAL